MAHIVSMIPYANMAPYRQLGPPEGCEWAYITPKQSSVALSEGRVLAAAAPVGDLPWLANEVDFLGSYGVAANGAVKSVLFLSDRPFAEMRRPQRIDVTDQSATSVRLLYLLFGYKFGFDQLPMLPGQDEASNGSLVIGDEALTRSKNLDRPFVTDLATEWFDATGLPVVFARWVIRKDAPDEARQAMESWLAKLHDRDEQLVEESAPAEAKRLGMDTQAMVQYLRGMKRALGERELHAQEVFLSEFAKHGRETLFETAGGPGI